MKRLAMLGGLAVVMAATVVLPPPQSVLGSSRHVFYGVAIYKSLVGDADGTLRMLQKSVEQPAAPAATRTAVSTCTGVPRG